MFRVEILTDFEAKYSINELEKILATVWAVDHFKSYVYGVHFKIISDQALMSVLKPNRGNKTYSSRLTRWVDRLTFNFKSGTCIRKNAWNGRVPI